VGGDDVQQPIQQKLAATLDDMVGNNLVHTELFFVGFETELPHNALFVMSPRRRPGGSNVTKIEGVDSTCRAY